MAKTSRPTADHAAPAATCLERELEHLARHLEVRGDEVLGVLVAHETGHYVAARLHRVDASPPFFIPIPFGFGTMGAVIRMRGRIATRAALLLDKGLGDVFQHAPLPRLRVVGRRW